MKKLLLFALSGCMLLSFAGCKKNDSETTPNISLEIQQDKQESTNELVEETVSVETKPPVAVMDFDDYVGVMYYIGEERLFLGHSAEFLSTLTEETLLAAPVCLSGDKHLVSTEILEGDMLEPNSWVSLRVDSKAAPNSTCSIIMMNTNEQADSINSCYVKALCFTNNDVFGNARSVSNWTADDLLAMLGDNYSVKEISATRSYQWDLSVYIWEMQGYANMVAIVREDAVVLGIACVDNTITSDFIDYATEAWKI